MPLTARQEAGIRPPRRAHGREPLVRQPPRLPLLVRRPADGETFEGLAFGDYANTSPDGTVVAAHVYEGSTDEIMGRPNPDPGEEFPHVNTQLFDTVDPPRTPSSSSSRMTAPFNAPPRNVDATMSGFVRDYWINYLRLRKGTPPSRRRGRADHGVVLPADAARCSPRSRRTSPSTTTGTAPCRRRPSATDRSSTPRPRTDSSRTRRAAATTSGSTHRRRPTIFNRLEEAGVSWRIYFDELQLVSFTGVLHAPVLEQYWRTERFATMSDFYEDVKLGTLPAYSFIEPRMMYNHNDFHPPFGRLRESDVDGVEVIDSAVSDVRAGEALVHEIYEAIKRSARPDGSNAMNTMLLITFDEHGGTYDHVAPPPATPPHDDSTGRDGLRVRSARMPRAGDRRVGLHARRHDHPRRDAPRGRDRHALAAARTEAAHAARPRREQPVQRREPRRSRGSRSAGRRRRRSTSRRTRRPRRRIRPTRTRTSRSARPRADCSGCSSRSTAPPTTTSPRPTPTPTSCSTATGSGCSASRFVAVEGTVVDHR